MGKYRGLQFQKKTCPFSESFNKGVFDLIGKEEDLVYRFNATYHWYGLFKRFFNAHL